MRSKFFTIEQILTILTGNPQRITMLTVSLAPMQLHTPPSQDAWSVNDILAHLRACGDIWGGNIIKMVSEDTPTLVGVNPRSWIKKTDYREQEFLPSLRAFTKQRAELLAILEALPPEGWFRTPTVTGMVGDVYERTIFYICGAYGSPRTDTRQADRTYREHDGQAGTTSA